MSSFQRAQKIYDAISRRRSIRQYSSDDVSPDTVRRLISMAVMAPLAHNRQPWPFVVSRAESRTRQTRQRISSAHWRSPDSSMENPGNYTPRLDDRFHEITRLHLGLSIHGMRPFRPSLMIRTLEALD